MQKHKAMAILEGLLFASDKSLYIDELSKILEISVKEVLECLHSLKDEYLKKYHGINVSILGNRVRFTTKPEISGYIEKFFKPKEKERLSKAALETLAIIMFQQPVTKVEIDSVRGVSSEKALKTLESKNLICEYGRLDKPGRPILYATTENCLEYFGIYDIEEIKLAYKDVLKNNI